MSFMSHIAPASSKDCAGLAVESATVRKCLCDRHPEVLKHMVSCGRPRPETSTMAFILFDHEDGATRHLVEILKEFHWDLVCPVYDAVLAMPTPQALQGTADAICQQFELDTGLKLRAEVLR